MGSRGCEPCMSQSVALKFTHSIALALTAIHACPAHAVHAGLATAVAQNNSHRCSRSACSCCCRAVNLAAVQYCWCTSGVGCGLVAGACIHACNAMDCKVHQNRGALCGLTKFRIFADCPHFIAWCTFGRKYKCLQQLTGQRGTSFSCRRDSSSTELRRTLTQSNRHQTSKPRSHVRPLRAIDTATAMSTPLATALWAASALLSASTGATATTDPAAQPRGSSSAPYDATWASLNTRAFPAWYNQAKFGFKIHWGPYAVPGWGQKYDAQGRQEPVFAQSCLYEYVTLVSSLPFQCINEDCKHSLFLDADTCFSCASSIHVTCFSCASASYTASKGNACGSSLVHCCHRTRPDLL